MEIITTSIITCPACGYSKKEEMPADACQYFYECGNCKTVLKPKSGDCCVYCSYGTVKCTLSSRTKVVAKQEKQVLKWGSLRQNPS